MGNIYSQRDLLPAPRCNCSVEGTVDPNSCDPLTGHCTCLPGYASPQCRDCEDGYFTNGTSGCVPCTCDSYGSVGPSCNRNSSLRPASATLPRGKGEELYPHRRPICQATSPAGWTQTNEDERGRP
ncbi:hypothetical protein P4O66_002817 [Electrophorus voltai]|uniref:Laminin EGF-like domain-containing protein n=1 Tax=Electrophorus voltai TaxID=2609070 RepID=A0AAD8YUA6_9TELE|nr:hypothetical protein P4O66_002817 [Electrophorus voltai]